MGNYNPRNITFRQSAYDFPLTVSLGNKAPAWGLSRWGGNSALRFIPSNDEGFVLRGDRRRLVYKGRRRSHRFTILSDGVFEHDVILEWEPESNVIVLPMEGTEQFDFFRQPDFVKDPLLSGSYAVYKKETLLGEGTGKLCHIHRPEIIDARGRRCWGDLSVAGNCLCIKIPEQWLAEAKYPVVVDPVLGTEQIGTHETYGQFIGDWDRPYLLWHIGFNKYYVDETISGNCTFNLYAFTPRNYESAYVNIYTDKNNYPYEKMVEYWFGVSPQVKPPLYPQGWRTCLFELKENANAGSYYWFGARSVFFSTKFDYVDYELVRIFTPNVNAFPPIIDSSFEKEPLNIRFSWYFSYVTSQNYVRTITQGVKMSETRKLTGEHKRTAVQEVKSSGCANTIFSYVRSLLDMVLPLETINKKGAFLRLIEMTAKGTSETKKKGDYCRETIETVKTAGIVSCGLLLFVRIITKVFIRDYILGRFLKAREELKLKSCISREITLDSKII